MTNLDEAHRHLLERAQNSFLEYRTHAYTVNMAILRALRELPEQDRLPFIVHLRRTITTLHYLSPNPPPPL